MDFWLPVVFAGLMALAMLIYVVLDGYDLGVGVLLNGADDQEKDMMIASIGPFWDANETWLVLGVGILLIAFPMAHGVILSSLYLPVAAMLVGLILRGVAFDFRVKAREPRKPLWNGAFFCGSLLASLSQGFMLGHYITGFEQTWGAYAFSLLISVSVVAGYALLGATWLIMKSEHELQAKAIRWAQRALWLTAAGIAAVSIATPLISTRVFDKWFSFPQFLFLSQIPAISIAMILACHFRLKKLAVTIDEREWVPFALDRQHLCPGVRGARLQPVSLPAHRRSHNLGCGECDELAAVRALGCVDYAAGHPWLHRVCLSRLLGQDA